jgi:hypothetical protein
VIAAFRAGGRLLPRVPVPFDAYLGMTRVARDRGNAEYFYTDRWGCAPTRWASWPACSARTCRADTPNQAAASGWVIPASTAATTRSHRSIEYARTSGLGTPANQPAHRCQAPAPGLGRERR